MWQLVRAIHFCHQHNIIHRDIKPENLLVSRNGVLKLCDFGFARPLAGPGAKYTEYVSTRWYRAPELLVGDVSYGKAVDVWSIGCMFAEITTGLPLFPGDSDIDQLYHIIKCLGHITPRHQELFKKNSLYVGVKLPHATEREPLDARFPHLDKHSLDFLSQTIRDEPLDRWTCAELLNHPFFENAGAQFELELQDAIQRDLNDTMALRKKRLRSQKLQQPVQNGMQQPMQQQPPPPSRGSGQGGQGYGQGGHGRSPSTSVAPDELTVFPPSYSNSYDAATAAGAGGGGGGKPAAVFKPMPVGVQASKDKHAMAALGVSQPTKKAAISTTSMTATGAGAAGSTTAAGAGAMNSTLLPTLSSMTPSSSSTSNDEHREHRVAGVVVESAALAQEGPQRAAAAERPPRRAHPAAQRAAAARVAHVTRRAARAVSLGRGRHESDGVPLVCAAAQTAADVLRQDVRQRAPHADGRRRRQAAAAARLPSVHDFLDWRRPRPRASSQAESTATVLAAAATRSRASWRTVCRARWRFTRPRSSRVRTRSRTSRTATSAACIRWRSHRSRPI
ncbi:hypothetical protein PINS_up004862 [Pythium insidiosum]|nr:hypothetical protein PINS_up004862 [Pythium insidiosum]